MLKQRRRREDLLGRDLFADPAWDMLLDLFAARVDGQQISAKSLVLAAAVPQSTAFRWINDLASRGLVERRPDRTDGRRTFVSLTDEACEVMRLLLVERLQEAERMAMSDS